MVLVNAWKTVVLGNYANFGGRASRGEYWWYTLATVIVTVGLNVLGSVLGDLAGILGGLYALGVFIPGLAVSVRRLHDTGRSGWVLLLALIPIVGFIILLVWAASPSASGENKYGPAPQSATA